MAKHEDLPFPIGTTYFDGQTADTTTVQAINLEGKEYELEDLFYLGNATSLTGFTATKILRTAYLKKVRIMRNVSGVALAPGFLCVPSRTGTDGRYFLGRTDGYANIGGPIPSITVPAYGIDEFIPTTLNVPNNDLFYAVTDGPWLGNLSATAAELLGQSSGNSTAISFGDVLTVGTAAASTFATTQTATMTCGRIANVSMGAVAGTTLGNILLNRIGRALSTVTTGQTTASFLMYFTKF